MLKPFNTTGTYVCYPMVNIVEANRTLHNKKLQEICLFDLAESQLGLGQINLRKTSSFCESGNYVNGINVVKKGWKQQSTGKGMFEKDKIDDEQFEYCTIWDYNKQVKNNINEIKTKGFESGIHICCACEYEIGTAGDDMYAGIGIGVPKDKKNAILFMESVGKTEKTTDKEVVNDIVNSIKEIGSNQQIKYDEIYVAYQHKAIRTDLGCALVIVPYFLEEDKDESRN